MKYKELNEQEKNSVKRKFGKILEYSFITKHDDMLLDEDDDPQPEADPNAPQNGMDMGMQQSDPSSIPPATEPMNDPAQGSSPADVSPQPDVTPTDVNAQPDAMPEIPMDNQPEMPAPEMSAESPKVEVDVTQLTQDQKQVDDKVSALTDQTAQMMELLATITDKVDGITTKINDDNESIRQEIAKRNPTPKEVLQKRQTLADPFNQTPEDFWKQKEAEGEYELKDDGEKEYEIKPSDLDDNPMNVYKSFGIKDDEVNQSLKGILGY